MHFRPSVNTFRSSFDNLRHLIHFRSSSARTSSTSNVRHHTSYGLRHRQDFWVVVAAGVLLTMFSGFVDMLGYLQYRTMTTHITGSVIKMIESFFTVSWVGIAATTSMFVGFVAGACVSALITGNTHFRLGRRYGVAAVIEALLLILGVILDQAADIHYIPVIALWATAAGLQNGIFTSFSGAVVRTTHLTGLVTDTGCTIAFFSFFRVMGFSLQGLWMRYRRTKPHRVELWKLKMFLPQLAGFLIGAILARLAFRSLGTFAALFPASFLVIVGVIYFVETQRGVFVRMYKAREEAAGRRRHHHHHGHHGHHHHHQTHTSHPQLDSDPSLHDLHRNEGNVTHGFHHHGSHHHGSHHHHHHSVGHGTQSHIGHRGSHHHIGHGSPSHTSHHRLHQSGHLGHHHSGHHHHGGGNDPYLAHARSSPFRSARHPGHLPHSSSRHLSSHVRETTVPEADTSELQSSKRKITVSRSTTHPDLGIYRPDHYPTKPHSIRSRRRKHCFRSEYDLSSIISGDSRDDITSSHGEGDIVLADLTEEREPSCSDIPETPSKLAEIPDSGPEKMTCADEMEQSNFTGSSDVERAESIIRHSPTSHHYYLGDRRATRSSLGHDGETHHHHRHSEHSSSSSSHEAHSHHSSSQLSSMKPCHGASESVLSSVEKISQESISEDQDIRTSENQ